MRDLAAVERSDMVTDRGKFREEETNVAYGFSGNCQQRENDHVTTSWLLLGIVTTLQ